MDAPTMPDGLSALSQGVWRDLLTQHRFERFELEALGNALKWQDVSNALLADAETMTEPEKSRLRKLAIDASTCSLRYWRSLKFSTDGATRRPGRRPGDGWSDAPASSDAASRVSPCRPNSPTTRSHSRPRCTTC